MANFHTHLLGGFIVGIGGLIGGIHLDLVPLTMAPVVAIAGIFGGIAPDLDHDHGRPIRIMFGLAAIIIPPLIIFRFFPNFDTWFQFCQMWALGGVVIRYPICWIFKKLTVHRGIFHSVPAIGIFGCLLYLLTAHDVHNVQSQQTIAVCGSAGYLIHLLLDELWAVDFNGVATRVKRSFGSALALYKKSIFITALAYSLLGILFYLCWLDHQGTSPEDLIKI